MLRLIILLVRLLVALRYRIVIKGLERLNDQNLSRPGGILFLPNHPAEIDPVILMMVLLRKFPVRPLVVENFFYLNFVQFFLKLIKALPLPSMDIIASRWRGKKIEKLFQKILERLKSKDNFLIYPAGRLKLTGLELLGGASFIHNLVQAYPEVNIVLVRTTGLWGSSFSRALTGSVPPLGATFFKGFKILLKNGIFFAPRRTVTIELEPNPSDFPDLASRIDFNKYLERWYNRYPEEGAEPLTLVSYAFWKKELPGVALPNEPKKVVLAEAFIPKEIEKVCFAQLAKLSGHPPEQIQRTMHLSHDLGLDSLDVAQLYVFLDERYEISDLVPGDLHTVDDFLQAAAGFLRLEREDVSPKMGLLDWPEESGRSPVQGPVGETVQEAFLRSCDRMKQATACMDALSGHLSYRRFKQAALVLALKFRKIPGDHIGVMLPSSVAAYLVILAILLSKKIPVMLNWTAGVRALDHAADLCDLKAVISSDRFLDHLDNGEFGKLEQALVLLEDFRTTVTWKDKLKGFLLSLKKTPSLLQALGLDVLKSSDRAMILFTSGTEALPKGVPLTHANLLSNQRSALSCVDFGFNDILYGVLPPFHSFGFSVTGLMPLLSGLKICYAPDPNDCHGMAHDIEHWKPTIFCCAPSFIKALFHVADVKDLQSLRYVVSGAEKTPQELFDYVAKNIPHAKLLEGYGITECAPIVTMDRIDRPHKGVGQSLPGVEVCIYDSQTLEILPAGKEGEIGIRGPNVFQGYLSRVRDPFVTLQEKQWYSSGDRGRLDPDGTLFILGRLKRFVKIGGEMVSLGGLEAELLRLAKEKKWITGKEEGPALAVSVQEKDVEKSLIVLYTTFEISKDEVNSALKECGFGRIVKISEVRKLEEIPLTGTGKTHYRLLDETFGKR